MRFWPLVGRSRRARVAKPYGNYKGGAAMGGRLQDKVALVTGAGSGFGEGIARRFAEEGAAVLAVDLNGPAAERVAGEIAAAGGTARAFTADVTRKDQVEAMVAAAESGFGGLDVLVNNAGWSHRNKPSDQVSEEEFDKLFAVNVKSVYLGILAALPLLRARQGSIVNTSSTAALRPRPNLTFYNATKGAVNVMTKSLAVELAPAVRVNALCPVIGETALMETFMGAPDTPENRQRFLAGIPMGRFSKPLDIANAALFLASAEANFLTGVCLEVDGGRCV